MQEAILIPSHILSHALSDVQNNSKTYVKELLQINDIIILPHTQQEKARDTDRQSDIQSTTTHDTY